MAHDYLKALCEKMQKEFGNSPYPEIVAAYDVSETFVKMRDFRFKQIT